MNNELLEELDNAVDYFTVVDHYTSLINEYKADIEFQRDKYWELKSTKKSFAIVSFIIIFASFVIAAFFMATVSSTDLPQSVADYGFGIIIAVGITVSIIYAIHRISLQKAIARKADEFWQKEGFEITADNEKTIEEISCALKEFIDSNSDVLVNIPLEYQDSYAVYFMANAVRNMRAATIGEAINLYEEDKHRTEMQFAMNDLLYNQSKMNNELSELNEREVETNRRLKNIENLQKFDLFFH